MIDRTIRECTIIYKKEKTKVTGRVFKDEDGNPDFCCETVKSNGKSITHLLFTPDFVAIEKLVLSLLNQTKK